VRLAILGGLTAILTAISLVLSAANVLVRRPLSKSFSQVDAGGSPVVFKQVRVQPGGKGRVAVAYRQDSRTSPAKRASRLRLGRAGQPARELLPAAYRSELGG